LARDTRAYLYSLRRFNASGKFDELGDVFLSWQGDSDLWWRWHHGRGRILDTTAHVTAQNEGKGMSDACVESSHDTLLENEAKIIGTTHCRSQGVIESRQLKMSDFSGNLRHRKYASW
jgi:hypothetical protein